jgi:hypothetical protein
MSKYSKPLALLASSGVMGLGFIMAAPDHASAGGGGLRCEIYQSHGGGGVTLQGVVFANGAVDGSYQFNITKSGGGGSSNINQGGEFSVGAGGKATLGQVSLGGDGGYTASLRVTADGHSVSCKERIGGSL